MQYTCHLLDGSVVVFLSFLLQLHCCSIRFFSRVLSLEFNTEENSDIFASIKLTHLSLNYINILYIRGGQRGPYLSGFHANFWFQ